MAGDQQREGVVDHLKEEVVVGLRLEVEVVVGLLMVEEAPLVVVELQLVVVVEELLKVGQVGDRVLMLGVLMVEVRMNSDWLTMLPSIPVYHLLQHFDPGRFQDLSQFLPDSSLSLPTLF